MPDYSACTNKKCSARKGCARFRMKWSKYRQTLSVYPGPDTTCEGYWPVDHVPFDLVTPEEAEKRGEK